MLRKLILVFLVFGVINGLGYYFLKERQAAKKLITHARTGCRTAIGPKLPPEINISIPPDVESAGGGGVNVIWLPKDVGGTTITCDYETGKGVIKATVNGKPLLMN